MSTCRFWTECARGEQAPGLVLPSSGFCRRRVGGGEQGELAGSHAQIACPFATLPGKAKAQDAPGLPRLGHTEGQLCAGHQAQPRGVGMAGQESPKEPRGGGHAGAVTSLVPLDFSSRLGGCPQPRLDWGGAHGLV